MLQNLVSEDDTKFKEFFTQYGVNLKLGVTEDKENQARLSKLLMFRSSKTGELTKFENYVERFKEGQEEIYYLAGESKEGVEKSPLAERLIRRGYEVLYMVDPIDEYMMQSLHKYDNKYKFVNIAREGLKLPGNDEDEEKLKETSEDFKPLTEFLKQTLGNQVEKVIVTNRLSKSPSALVSAQWGYTANMERIARAQALVDKGYFSKASKILEINPNHPINTELLNRIKNDPTDKIAIDVANLLYETAVLQFGFPVDDTSSFAERIHRMLKANLNLDPEAEAIDDEPTPEPTKPADEPSNLKDEL